MGEDPLVTVNDVVGFRSRVGYLRVNDSVAIRCGFGQDAHVAERGGRGKELGKVFLLNHYYQLGTFHVRSLPMKQKASQRVGTLVL